MSNKWILVGSIPTHGRMATMEDEPQPMRSKGSIPRVVYQRVDAELDFSGEALFCSTTMVLAFPQLTLSEESQFYLHCRVPVENVLINNLPAEYDLRDPLLSLHFDGERSNNFIGKEADVNFRSALEIADSGELLITIPKGFSSNKGHIDPLPLLPLPVAPDLASTFQTLEEISAAFNIDGGDDGMNVDDGNKQCNSENLMSIEEKGGEVEAKDAEAKKMKLNSSNLIQVRIDYAISGEHKKGLVFRRQSKCIAKWAMMGT